MKWKDLTYDDRIKENYEVSDKGDIRNKTTRKILKPRMKRQGYLDYKLMAKEKGKTIHVMEHIAVMKTFNPTSLQNVEIDHKNGFKFDNHLNNLQWVTSSYNNLHEERKEYEQKQL